MAQLPDALGVIGQCHAALRLLRKAVEGNYLAVQAMDQDPLLEPIRKTPEFAAIRAEAAGRQQEFLETRGAPAP